MKGGRAFEKMGENLQSTSGGNVSKRDLLGRCDWLKSVTGCDSSLEGWGFFYHHPISTHILLIFQPFHKIGKVINKICREKVKTLVIL